MSQRLDVRRMLLKRGWQEESLGVLRKDGALWALANAEGDSGLDAPRKAWSLAFDGGVPARVIVAAREAAIATTEKRTA